jgi:hypothetical protein
MNGSFGRASLELASPSGCRKIAEIDARSLSSDPRDFVKQNLFAYYIACNTWLMNVRMYSQYGWIRLGEYLSKVGLVAAINEAASSSELLINGSEITSPLFRQIVQDIMRPHVTWGMPHITATNVNQDPMATALQVLRYLKRFSPLGADKVEADSIQKFLNVENRNEQIQATNRFEAKPTNVALFHTRSVMADLLDWDSLCSEIELALQDPRNVEFTSGTARDAKTMLASKLQATLESNPEYFRPVQGYPLVGGMPNMCPVWYDRTSAPDSLDEQREKVLGRPFGQRCFEEARKVRVAAVPKSYKAARIIAMEDSYRQARAHMIFSIIDRYLPANIRLHDQTQNQELARLGSLTGEVATIDLTSASDTIARSLFWELFPLRFARLVYPFLGTHHIVNGKSRVMQMMATSGNSLTFVLESLVFLAIDMAADQYYSLFSGELATRCEDYPVPSVYGDDQIVWSDAYDITVQFLQALGFIVNESKSYTGDSPFRESCGSDWYLGVNVASIYFPRRPLRGTVMAKAIKADTTDLVRDSYLGEVNTTLSSLVSLQHRLFEVCPDAALFIRGIVLETKPNMTSSSAGSKWGDLWDFIDTSRIVWAPGVKRNLDTVMLSKLPDDAKQPYQRKLRLLPTVEYARPQDAEILPLVRRLYDVYRYQEFLRQGPRYADEHMRALGISERPLPIEAVLFPPTIRWRWIEATED